ncbi:MAG: UDP-4-amino-4,6-dideoxy-N-acetyl-beta-L-altrosamine transaminase [Pseudomonadota bacterium]
MTHAPLPYGRHAIDDDDIAAVVEVLKSDWLTTGPAVTTFEKTLCEALGARHAVAVANGTAALHLAYLALDIGPGDSVIVPAITFLATANAVRQTGADVVFADVDPETGIMTPATLRTAFQKAKSPVKAVTVVHLGGQPADLTALAKICQGHSAYLIEDACHAIGSTYGNTRIGDCAYSDVATFSFHPVKTIAMGEGGAVTTRHDHVAGTVRSLRHHAMQPPPAEIAQDSPWLRHASTLGYNYRACDIQCALGASQLNKLERFKTIRRALYEQYEATLAALDVPAMLNPIKTQCAPCWHLAAVSIDFNGISVARKDVVKQLADMSIGTQVHYYPVNAQPYYEALYGKPATPNAWTYYDRTLSLPLHAGMSLAEVNMVCRALAQILPAVDKAKCA